MRLASRWRAKKLIMICRPYQREGVDWMSFLREAGLGALLADDMGLGKTLQAIRRSPGAEFSRGDGGD